MARLTAAAVAAWPEDRLRSEYSSRLDRVKAIRESAGGTLANVQADDAEEVRELMAETNLIGDELDERAVASEHTASPRRTGGTFPLDGRSAGGSGPRPPVTPWTGAIRPDMPGVAPLAAIGTLDLPPVLVQQNIVELGRRTLLSLIPVQQLDTPNFAYLRQTVRTNNAAAVAVGALKPTSVITFEQVEDTVRTIATLSERIPRQYLDDFAALRTWIEQDFAFMVREEIETQVISGNGTPPNLTGLLNTSGIGVHAKGTDTLPDALHKAATIVELNSFRKPTAVVMNPSDAELLALLKTTTGEYLYVSPGSDFSPQLWGLPLVTTTGMAAGTALVGDFAGSAQLYEREGVRVDWSEHTFDPTVGTDGASDFETNRLRFRAEARVGLAVTRPAAFVKVTGVA
jgi:HK97 family phage major capsid protein